VIPDDLPSDLDKKIWSRPQGRLARGVKIPPGFQYQGLRSHVFLSACSVKEVACEDLVKDIGVLGVFTAALLNLLSQIDTRDITYAMLFKLLPPLPK
jgi:hypothetical protein